METERKMSLLCKIIGHKWKNVIETAVFSQTTYFHECSRCLITKEAEISEKGFVIKYAITEIRPKENDNFSGETTIESASLQDIRSLRKKFKNLNQVQSLSDLNILPRVYQTLICLNCGETRTHTPNQPMSMLCPDCEWNLKLEPSFTYWGQQLKLELAKIKEEIEKGDLKEE